MAGGGGIEMEQDKDLISFFSGKSLNSVRVVIFSRQLVIVVQWSVADLLESSIHLGVETLVLNNK